jgi:hypothetical protein
VPTKRHDRFYGRCAVSEGKESLVGLHVKQPQRTTAFPVKGHTLQTFAWW